MPNDPLEKIAVKVAMIAGEGIYSRLAEAHLEAAKQLRRSRYGYMVYAQAQVDLYMSLAHGYIKEANKLADRIAQMKEDG